MYRVVSRGELTRLHFPSVGSEDIAQLAVQGEEDGDDERNAGAEVGEQKQIEKLDRLPEQRRQLVLYPAALHHTVDTYKSICVSNPNQRPGMGPPHGAAKMYGSSVPNAKQKIKDKLKVYGPTDDPLTLAVNVYHRGRPVH